MNDWAFVVKFLHFFYFGKESDFIIPDRISIFRGQCMKGKGLSDESLQTWPVHRLLLKYTCV